MPFTMHPAHVHENTRLECVQIGHPAWALRAVQRQRRRHDGRTCSLGATAADGRNVGID